MPSHLVFLGMGLAEFCQMKLGKILMLLILGMEAGLAQAQESQTEDYFLSSVRYEVLNPNSFLGFAFDEEMTEKPILRASLEYTSILENSASPSKRVKIEALLTFEDPPASLWDAIQGTQETAIPLFRRAQGCKPAPSSKGVSVEISDQRFQMEISEKYWNDLVLSQENLQALSHLARTIHEIRPSNSEDGESYSHEADLRGLLRSMDLAHRATQSDRERRPQFVIQTDPLVQRLLFPDQFQETLTLERNELQPLLASISISLIPILGDFYDALCLVIGGDLFTGHRFDQVDYAMTILGVTSIAGGAALRSLDEIPEILRALRQEGISIRKWKMLDTGTGSGSILVNEKYVVRYSLFGDADYVDEVRTMRELEEMGVEVAPMRLLVDPRSRRPVGTLSSYVDGPLYGEAHAAGNLSTRQVGQFHESQNIGFEVGAIVKSDNARIANGRVIVVDPY